MAGKRTLASSVRALAPFWGGLTCDAVRGSTCRAYAAQAGVLDSTTRRRLSVLQSALNYALAEGKLIYAPKVTLTDSGIPRDRFLTRDEAARLLRAAPPHLRRFILIALATGTRHKAILGLRWTQSLNSGWVDLERGIIHRKGARERETKKRRGDVAIPRGLLDHLRRWARAGGSHVVMERGKPCGTIRRSFATACERAGLTDLHPHDLKRTAVTWAFQRGMTIEDAVSWFDTSAVTLQAVYRAHHPDHQARAKAIMERRT
ncbi:MAG: site-specific integrase [Amaricoccus sp.]